MDRRTNQDRALLDQKREAFMQSRASATSTPSMEPTVDCPSQNTAACQQCRSNHIGCALPDTVGAVGNKAFHSVFVSITC